MRSHEAEPTLELSPEQRLEHYAEILLTNSDGSERVAVAEHILAPDAEPGCITAQAHFYKKDGGFFIEEFRDHQPEPVFVSFVKPHPEHNPNDPQSPRWETGMLRKRWMRFSIYEVDNIPPVLGVIEAFFGKLPE